MNSVLDDEIGVRNREQTPKLERNRISATDVTEPPLDRCEMRSRPKPEEASRAGLCI